MAHIGNVSIFNPNEETFASYLERVEEYLVANDIGVVAGDATVAQKAVADRRKVSVLITLVGPKVYGTLRDLCSPATPKEKSFTDLCALLQNYVLPSKDNPSV